jgi:hypothetical protein
MSYNELKISYQHADGRTFKTERGKGTIDIGYESHGMFVMKLKYDWGPYTYNSILLDQRNDAGVLEYQPYLGDLIKAVLSVFGADSLSSIKNLEAYILFDEKRDPVGFVNIKDTQNFLLFPDFFKQYGK